VFYKVKELNRKHFYNLLEDTATITATRIIYVTKLKSFQELPVAQNNTVVP